MFGSIGMPELIVIFILVLLIFGPTKLPDLGKSLGEAIRGLKKAMNEPDKSNLEVRTVPRNRANPPSRTPTNLFSA
jgi:sec-independent protein translocase protein TatA